MRGAFIRAVPRQAPKPQPAMTENGFYAIDAPCDVCVTGDYPIPLVDADDGKVLVQRSRLAEIA
jgi:hypothetical protein